MYIDVKLHCLNLCTKMFHINPNYYRKIQQDIINKEKKITLIKSQYDLLLSLASGLTINQIAKKFDKKENDIKKRTQNLYRKFTSLIAKT